MGFVENRIKKFMNNNPLLVDEEILLYSGCKIQIPDISYNTITAYLVATKEFLFLIKDEEIIFLNHWEKVFTFKTIEYSPNTVELISWIPNREFNKGIYKPQFPYMHYGKVKIYFSDSGESQGNFKKLFRSKKFMQGLRPELESTFEDWMEQFVPQITPESQWPEEERNYIVNGEIEIRDCLRLLIYCGKQVCFGYPKELLEMAVSEFEETTSKIAQEFGYLTELSEDFRKLIQRTLAASAPITWKNQNLAPIATQTTQANPLLWTIIRISTRNPEDFIGMSMPVDEWQDAYIVKQRRAVARTVPENKEFPGLKGYPHLEIWNDFNEGTILAPCHRITLIDSDFQEFTFPQSKVWVKNRDAQNILSILKPLS